MQASDLCSVVSVGLAIVLTALALAQFPPPPSPSEPLPHPFHACHEFLKVEENWDPRGDPGMLPCATTDAEMEEFYKEAMEPDLKFWRERAPLNRSRIDAFMKTWGDLNWPLQGFVLILKNRWYFPFQ
ncbi:hypothetical protein TSOC_005104 [Tetrabaena socialis]|uniref:Uncharacterized protein n=1 Tax=Tetrabaena socialis TaxID=47790 RepID=A0A2J8A793_9CHLO|nr:hypothetical protein TSOC_005104 [Tetrabaena socialis]|eukprot:PNH08360.1 hypothetical protein TSOC_005104 [Tetrabaena socialis]